MAAQPFSKRYGLGGDSEELIDGRVPTRVRRDLFSLVAETIGSLSIGKCTVHRALLSFSPSLRSREDVGWTTSSDIAMERILTVIRVCNWYEFYDICEEFHRIVASVSEELAPAIDVALNQLFRAGGIGYLIRDGSIERVGAAFTDKKIAEARILLREPGFEGPDEQFEKAISFLSQRPEPDWLNCVKEAVGAVEGLARILTGDHTADLHKIVGKLVAQNIIPKPLDQALVKVYAYRGDAPGVAHGLVGQPKPGIEEAEFVLSMCASMIIYLAKKFGKQVV